MAKIRKQETLDYTALKRELKSKGPENLYTGNHLCSLSESRCNRLLLPST